MRLVTFGTAGGRQAIGALVDGDRRVVDLPASYETRYGRPAPALQSMIALMEAGEEGLARARDLTRSAEHSHAASEVRLLAPVPVPMQIRDCLAFEQHMRQAGQARARLRTRLEGKPVAPPDILPVWYEQPLYYKSNRFSVIGPDTDVVWPSGCSFLDYEHEFGIFIGRNGRDIMRAAAGSHIFGYTIFNDVSARDFQYREMPAGLGPAKGKDFDTGNVIGPCIVTPDELPDPYNLTMTTRLNGKVVNTGNSGTIHHRFDRIIEHVSANETLHCGEFIGSGTVGGGCGLELDIWLEPGDVVELEVEGIGILRNRITDPGNRRRPRP